MRFESQDFIKSQRQWRESRDRIPNTTKPKTATTPEEIGNVTSFSRSLSSRNSNSSNTGSGISNSIHKQRYKYRNDYESRKQHKQEGTFVAVSNNDARSRDDDNDDADNAHRRRIRIQEDDFLLCNDGKMEYTKNDEKELLTAKRNNTDFLPDFSKKELEHLRRSRRIKQIATAATAIRHNDDNKKESNCGLCDFIPTNTEQEYNITTCNAAAAAAAVSAIRTDYKSSSSRNDYYHTTTNDDNDSKGYRSSKGNVSENLESFTGRITGMYEEYTDEIRIGSVKAFLDINDQIKNTMHIHAGAGTKSGSNDQQQKQKQKMKSARCSHNHYNSKEGEVQVQVVNFIVDAAILFNVLPNHVWSENFLKDSRGALNKIQERMILDYNHDNN